MIEIELKKQQHPAVENPWVAMFVAGGIVEAMAWWVEASEPPLIKDMKRELNNLAQATLASRIEVECPSDL